MTKYNVTVTRANKSTTDYTGVAIFRGLSDFNDDEVLETLDGRTIARYTACMGWTRPDGITAVALVASEAE